MSSHVEIARLQSLLDLIGQYKSAFSINNNRGLLFSGDISSIAGELSALQLSSTPDVNGSIVNISSIVGGNKIVFKEWLDQDFDSSNLNASAVFISLTEGFVAYENGSITANSGSDEFKNIIQGVISYYRLKGLFQQDGVCDHHNAAKAEFVFYSSTKGVLKVAYQFVAPKRNLWIQENKISGLITLLQNPLYKIYFINGLFKISNDKPIIELLSIMDQADTVTDIIKRDYEIALKQFDFEKFKDNLLKEKDKYFNSIREVLNKVFGQLVGIPISISASVFATYKVENEPLTLWLIAIGFLLYVCLYVRIQLIYKRDLIEIGEDFNRDFERIKHNSGLDAGVIEIERKKVVGKIASTKSLITFMIFSIIALGATVIYYLADQITLASLKIKFIDLFLSMFYKKP